MATVITFVCGCGVQSLEEVSLADGVSPNSCAAPESAFSLRVVYTVTNSFEAASLKAAGAPTHARGVEKTELLIRDAQTLVRRTGTAWVKDPDQYWSWQEDGDFLSDPTLTAQEALDKGLSWKAAGEQIPMVTAPIEWVDVRQPAPDYSYRYGLDPMAPLRGERWRERARRVTPEDLATAVLNTQFPALSTQATDGVTVSTAEFAGTACEMLRKREGKRVHETCYATLGDRTVVLHGMDSSPDGVRSQTAVSVEQGLCLPDTHFAAPGRVRFQEVSG